MDGCILCACKNVVYTLACALSLSNTHTHTHTNTHAQTHTHVHVHTLTSWVTGTSVLAADISKHTSVNDLPPHGLLEKGIAAASPRLFPALLKQVEGTSRRRHANASAYTPKLNSEGDGDEIMQHLIEAELDSIYSDFWSVCHISIHRSLCQLFQVCY